MKGWAGGQSELFMTSSSAGSWVYSSLPSAVPGGAGRDHLNRNIICTCEHEEGPIYNSTYRLFIND